MFGEWLEAQLTLRGWSNAQLAQAVGVTTGAVWSWRHNEYPPAIKHLPEIAAAFKISEWEVYCRVRGIDHATMSDGYLMRQLRILPDDAPWLLDLTGTILQSIRVWIAAQEAADSTASSSPRAAATVLPAQFLWLLGTDPDQANGNGDNGPGGPPARPKPRNPRRASG